MLVLDQLEERVLRELVGAGGDEEWVVFELVLVIGELREDRLGVIASW